MRTYYVRVATYTHYEYFSYEADDAQHALEQYVDDPLAEYSPDSVEITVRLTPFYPDQS